MVYMRIFCRMRLPAEIVGEKAKPCGYLLVGWLCIVYQ